MKMSKSWQQNKQHGARYFLVCITIGVKTQANRKCSCLLFHISVVRQSLMIVHYVALAWNVQIDGPSVVWDARVLQSIRQRWRYHKIKTHITSKSLDTQNRAQLEYLVIIIMI